MKSDKRKPDYKVKARRRNGSQDGQIGAAWLNEDGSINITLNAFVVLAANTDLQITLFPRDDYPAQPE